MLRAYLEDGDICCLICGSKLTLGKRCDCNVLAEHHKFFAKLQIYMYSQKIVGLIKNDYMLSEMTDTTPNEDMAVEALHTRSVAANYNLAQVCHNCLYLNTSMCEGCTFTPSKYKQKPQEAL